MRVSPLEPPTNFLLVGLEGMYEKHACAAAVENCVREAVAAAGRNETDVMKILTECTTGSKPDPD